jgi:hypothetical protein
MGFYYRKSVNLGPFRVNLSKSGVDQPPSRDTSPDRAARLIETTRGILSYSGIALLLAE